MASTTTAPGGTGAPDRLDALDRYFSITARGSTWQREVRGGLATFFTMAYIVVLNPLILGTVADVDGGFLGGATDPSGAIPLVAAATAFVAGIATLLMGVIGRYPFALATGLGLNAFVAFSIASDMTWADAMGLVVIEGLVITVLVLTGFRTAVFHAIPAQLKTAIGVGIGLFIALIGFVDAGFIRGQASSPPLQLGIGGNLQGWPTAVFVVGLLLTFVLVARRVKGAILLGIVATTVLAIVVEAIGGLGARGDDNPTGWSLVEPKLPSDIVSTPDLGLLGDFNLLGSFDRIGVVAAVLLVFTLMLADFFDTMGTVVGVGAEGDLLDEKGDLPGLERVLLVDSIAAVGGGAASTSSATTYVESAAGVGEGARTGLASVVTGVLFLLAMFFTPLVQVVPFEAATPALVVVGFLMLTQIKAIDFSDYSIGIPAFLTISVMPFTYSISNGIGAGFVSYAVIKLVSGRARDVHPLLWLVSALFVVYFAIVPLEELLGVR
ncbi:NCS2 family permease [Motilibacter deserti]|uniref:NCS2 family permease n=1 Tax=Motilibacter deserti TaxID=2714956 RepID=A0ABX0GVN4_9ACTN|nr:NCS2 family permease [Motilibacter deserti]NHC14573.1 NCS2 family permease [Motilibacter deserti]